jgi:hypothetical protein
MATHPGTSRRGWVDLKEIGITWEVSATAKAVIAFATDAGGDGPI